MTHIIANPSTECRVCHTPSVKYTLITEWDNSINGKRWTFHSPVCGDWNCVDMLKDRLLDRLWNMHGKVNIMFTLASSYALYNDNDDPFGE